ncbi:hypothetical protein PMAYCL1PPCAC_29355 [Pristionchus mayeri]|uniref:BACK domain-containing protein n=1 Tax=Pristionchus mayeri TaxID=1317129 RepID=A0AAN5ICJ1_9BILA|nr:hypothetical protein PMAYCL1PPCAC_29355 [Pristionchus mayeri]
MSLSTVAPLLIWSMDGGSNWIARLAKATILKDFSRFLHSSDVFLLSLPVLEDLLRSQFVQATEVDILEGVLRWGEHELLKRLEATEPNVIADTMHSISRRGIKRWSLIWCLHRQTTQMLFGLSLLLRENPYPVHSSSRMLSLLHMIYSKRRVLVFARKLRGTKGRTTSCHSPDPSTVKAQQSGETQSSFLQSRAVNRFPD